jgi:phospholipase/carboxylesterase
MDPRTLTRRELLRLVSLASPLAAVAASACGGHAPERLMPAPSVGPASPVRSAQPGVQPLGLGGERDGVLVLPERRGPLPLIVMFHGAGGTGRRAARLLGPMAAELGCAVLAPDSRAHTWDAVTGAFGPDVRFLERALVEVAAQCDVTPGRVAAAGFSDGATYALALGRANGDRFSHLLAFSPGFLIPARRIGTPRIFVSHGRQDEVLPIASCSRVMVPRLQRDGYDVRYREFDGGHEIPPTVMREGVGFFLEAPSLPSPPE